MPRKSEGQKVVRTAAKKKAASGEHAKPPDDKRDKEIQAAAEKLGLTLKQWNENRWVVSKNDVRVGYLLCLGQGPEGKTDWAATQSDLESSGDLEEAMETLAGFSRKVTYTLTLEFPRDVSHTVTHAVEPAHVLMQAVVACRERLAPKGRKITNIYLRGPMASLVS